MKVQSCQRGATLTEFVVIAPLTVLMALSGIQVALLQQARLCLNYATFEAARAGARQNAGVEAIREAWLRGVTPLLSVSGMIRRGSGAGEPGLLARQLRNIASVSEAPFFRIEILSPTHKAFADFADPELQRRLHTNGARVIPNDDLDTRPTSTGAHSGVSIQQANILHLRITYGYRPRVPLVGAWFTQGMAWFGAGQDGYLAGLLASGRIPIVVETATPMLGPAIENDSMSGGGLPTDPDIPDGGTGGSDNTPPVDGGGPSTPPGTDIGTGPGSGASGDDQDFCGEGNAVAPS